MDMKEIRNEIDAIDTQLTTLFAQRMALCAQVADFKKANNLPIYVPRREQEILEKIANTTPEEYASYTQALYRVIFELSRCYQHNRNGAQMDPDSVLKNVFTRE